MRKFIFTLLFLDFLLCAVAQKKLPESGSITFDELKLDRCSFEPDAPAMKLFETDETSFELFANGGGSRLKVEHRTRIKIFNEKGYSFANINIPYLTKKSLGKIKELTAYVYSLDETGKISTQKLSKDDFFKQTVVGKLGVIKFTFPQLKPGSVVEYSYTRIEHNFYDIDPWDIQDDIPTAYSSYTVVTPKTSAFYFKVYGEDSVMKLPMRERNPALLYSGWYMENIPAFKAEPFMTSKKDNRIRMVFYHFPSISYGMNMFLNPLVIWKGGGEYLLTDTGFGGRIKKNIPGTEKILDTASKLSGTSEKIKYLYAAVKSQFPGVKEQGRTIGNLNEAWQTHSANSGEMNMILLNLFEKIKITSYPLLVSTRDHGITDRKFPSFAQLNGVDAVAMTDSTHYYVLDASLSHQPVDCPPMNILNREALLLRPNNIDWFLVEDKRALFKQSVMIMCSVNEDGKLEGTASLQHYNYAKQYVLDTADKEESADDRFFNRRTAGLKIISSEKTETDSDDDPLFETVEFTYEPDETNGFFFYKPSFMFRLPGNPFVAEKRKTNIEFVSNEEIVTSLLLDCPSSMEPDHLPGNVTLISPDSSLVLNRTVTNRPGKIGVTMSLQIKRSFFVKEDYDMIRDFFKKMQGLAAEEIILRKKK